MVDEGEEAEASAGLPRAETLSDDVSGSSVSGGLPARDSRPSGRGGLSDHTRKRIAAQLRTMYDAVAQQPVPDRFAELIARLDEGGREEV